MKKNYEKGFFAALGCAGLWGILPIYWKSLIPIPSSTIIIYRILMIAVVCVIAARFKYSWSRIFSPLKDWRTSLKFFVAGLIVTSNWSIYIWAVNSGHIIQTSIGYYIEPLVVCIFGAIFFKEKLTVYKSTAVILAAASVIVILVHFGQVPGIALILATTFAIYSAIKKTVDQPPVISLLYETIFMAPIMLCVIVWLELHGAGALGVGESYQYFLLLLCGLATAIPLGLFAYAAQRTSMFVLGLTEYLSPTLALMLGIFLYKEPVDKVLIMAFGLIWIGLIFFSYGEFKSGKDSKSSENSQNVKAS